MNDREFLQVDGRMDPRDLVRSLNELLPADRKVVTDGGHFTRWVVDGLQTDPEDFTFSVDFASIGMGLPMGVGTAIAAGDQPCVAVCGDAGFMISLPELETAVRHDLPLTVIVWNDSAHGTEYHGLEIEGYEPDIARKSTPEFADVAESLGATGYTARDVEELAAVVEDVEFDPDQDGPVVVDCKVSLHVRHRSKG